MSTARRCLRQRRAHLYRARSSGRAQGRYGLQEDAFDDVVPPRALYLHGLSFGEFFWRFQQAEGYDYAANQAHSRNVSVVIDRLGYVSSDKPNGNKVCVGSRADMAHQMVMALRSGSAYSFGDIDGLIVMSYSDRVQSALLKRNAAYNARICARGGLRVGGIGPAGYAPFGPPSGADRSLFHSAQPGVENAALQLH